MRCQSSKQSAFILGNFTEHKRINTFSSIPQFFLIVIEVVRPNQIDIFLLSLHRSSLNQFHIILDPSITVMTSYQLLRFIVKISNPIEVFDTEAHESNRIISQLLSVIHWITTSILISVSWLIICFT